MLRHGTIKIIEYFTIRTDLFYSPRCHRVLFFRLVTSWFSLRRTVHENSHHRLIIQSTWKCETDKSSARNLSLSQFLYVNTMVLFWYRKSLLKVVNFSIYHQKKNNEKPDIKESFDIGLQILYNSQQEHDDYMVVQGPDAWTSFPMNGENQSLGLYRTECTVEPQGQCGRSVWKYPSSDIIIE